MKNLIEYFFTLLFYYFFRFLGVRVSSLLGGVILYTYGLFSKRNVIVKNNLKKAFPNITKEKSDKITKRMWFHFGRVMGEYPNLQKLEIGDENNIAIDNEKNLINPLKKYSNCLFFSAHIGNWELTSHLLTKSGYKIHFIYRAPNNKFVDSLLSNIRIGYGVGLIKKGNLGAKECLKLLKSKGGNIGMLIDQKMNDGITTKFFNEKVRSASAIAKFALKFNCPIIPAICIREKSIKFRVSYLDTITPAQIQKIGNETQIMNYLNKYLEQWIIKYPEQWIWFHNRWNN